MDTDNEEYNFMHKGIFITGTDTDAGKTVVAAGLLNFLRRNSIDAVPMKPIQTGCTKTETGYIVPDLECSLKISGMEVVDKEKELLSPYCYEPACSPHLAAEMADIYPSIAKIKNNISELSKNHECILVEGAGGIMVPINKTEMMLDLMKEIGFPVILVARAGLGTINHTLMSVEILRNAGLNLLGVFINNVLPESKDDEFIRKNNICAIEKYGNVKIIGNLKHIPQGELTDNQNDKFTGLFEKSFFLDQSILDSTL